MFVVGCTLPLSYCLPSVLISQPPFSHHKEIVLLDPPPLAHLSSCSSAPPEEDCGSYIKKREQYKQAGGHDIKCSSFTGPQSLVSSLFFQESRRVNLLFFLFLFPATFFQEAGKTLASHLVASPPLTYCSVLHRTRRDCILPRSIIPHPHFHHHSLRQKSIVSVHSLLSPPQSHLFNLSSLSRVVFFFRAHRRERVS